MIVDLCMKASPFVSGSAKLAPSSSGTVTTFVAMWLSINVVDRHVLYIIYTYIPNLLSLSCSVVQGPTYVKCGRCYPFSDSHTQHHH